MSESQTVCVFTVGHSNVEMTAFLALLRQHAIAVLADVRSEPYSKFVPHFNRDALEPAVKAAGMDYVFLGRELVGLHLLETPKVDEFVTTFPRKGSDTVEKVRYVEPQASSSPRPSPRRGEGGRRPGEDVAGLVFINDEQFSAGVRPEEWEFHVGGYQVLQKWLKDRKGRKLSNDDIRHYQRVVVAIRETIRLMAEIDKAIPQWPME